MSDVNEGCNMIILDVAIQYSTWTKFGITYSFEHGSISYTHWWFFYAQQSGVPVAWVLASRNTSADISLWLEQLMVRCYKIRPDWKVNVFMVDDALAEIVDLR